MKSVKQLHITGKKINVKMTMIDETKTLVESNESIGNFIYDKSFTAKVAIVEKYENVIPYMIAHILQYTDATTVKMDNVVVWSKGGDINALCEKLGYNKPLAE